MNVDIFTLCEGCDIGIDGAFTIFRSMSQYFAESFPANVRGVVVFRIEVDEHDQGDRAFLVTILEKDGRQIGELGGSLTTQLAPGRRYGTITFRKKVILPVSAPTVLTLRLQIEGSGDHEIHFTVLGRS